jgi:hypothetical protein
MRQFFACLLLLFPGSAVLAANPVADFEPDPKSVQRYGPAYRYPQAGWIVLHIEGEPYERGYQHGRLLSDEIAGHVRCFAATLGPKAPPEAWKHTRRLVNALFLRRYDPEYLEEMKGIADGASAAGARFEGRPIDLVDIAAINAWPEVETLDSALEATATGLEGKTFKHSQPRAMPQAKPMHCSAFAATGPATRDGKVVFGHITMFGLYPANFYNVWLDVKPVQGRRVFMQSFPGGIQSGMDYYTNDAGLLICETTIAQTKFDVQGMVLASRIRQAMQYADNIDKAVEILKKDNNGLYTNEWLLADVKTNEIAMFELGTKQTRLFRSSKNEWFGDTPGFYWGCNNTKDVHVELETLASLDSRPANAVFHPSDRDKTWLRLYHEHKGKIDADFGKLAFTTPPLAAYHSLDAKFTTTDLARQNKSWALFGPPLGRTWQPTFEERQRYPEIRPLVHNPWTILHPSPPAKASPDAKVAVDLETGKKNNRKAIAVAKNGDDDDEDAFPQPPGSVPAWHGTILPKTDADIWLATGFANYERIVALQKSLLSSKKPLDRSARERISVELYVHRSNVLAALQSQHSAQTTANGPDLLHDEWYRIASGKGVWLLHELRRTVGDKKFLEVMDSFGRTHAGKKVAVAEFEQHLEDCGCKDGTALLRSNGQGHGWQKLELAGAKLAPKQAANGDGGYFVDLDLRRAPGFPSKELEVTIETADGEETRSVSLADGKTPRLETKERPSRVVVDKYGLTAKQNGGTFMTLSFLQELEHTLIVYGTRDEEPSQREAAEALQQAIIQRHSNYTVPIRSDKNVSEEELKSHHLLLIGRPDTNSLVERWRDKLPISFGPRSFTVLEDSYAHANSAVLVAGANPANPRYSIVVVAGLSAAATREAAPALGRGTRPGEVVVLPHGGPPRALVVPAKELVFEFGKE